MSYLANKLTVIAVLNATIVVATLAILVAFFVLAWWNRTHDQIRARFWASIGVGLMGSIIAGRLLLTAESPADALFEKYLPGTSLFLTAALAWLLVTLKEERKELDFATVFAINLKTSRTLEEEERSYHSSRQAWRDAHIVESLLADQGAAAKLHTGDAKGLGRTTDMYHGVLLRCLLDQLFERYQPHWDLRVTQYQLPYATHTSYGPREDSPGMKTILWDEVEKQFPDCLAITQPEQHLKSIALPLGTKFEGKSETPRGNLLTYQIILSHPFFSITVATTDGGGCKGLGRYGELLDYSNDRSDQYWMAIYKVQLSAHFYRLTMGHPDTKRYLRWVNEMFAMIQNEFDIDRQWERQKEWYLLFGRRGKGKGETDRGTRIDQ